MLTYGENLNKAIKICNKGDNTRPFPSIALMIKVCTEVFSLSSSTVVLSSPLQKKQVILRVNDMTVSSNGLFDDLQSSTKI